MRVAASNLARYFDVDSMDHVMRLAADRVSRRGPPPLQRLLSELRQDAMSAALAPRRARAAALGDRMRAGEQGASGELAALATEALEAMRADVRHRARRVGAGAGLVDLLDAVWRDSEASELLDDPELDVETRTGIMSGLDTFNRVFATYDRFFAEILPLACPTGPTRVLDLAAGHGGFALAAARTARRRGSDLCFTASDIKQEYLDLGAAVARREALPVEFIVQDAFDLTNLEVTAYDLIVCTQSLHHFPPGRISVMFANATRVAGRGVVFVDGYRSALAGVGAIPYGILRLRNLAWVHDAVVSLRRCYVPEELELLARLADPDGAIESRWLPPGHCLLRWSTLSSAGR